MPFGSIYFAARQYFIFTTKALHYVYVPHFPELSPVDGPFSQALIHVLSPTLHTEYRKLLLPFPSPLLSCLLPFAQRPGLEFINSLVILALTNLYQELAAPLCPGTWTKSGPRLSTGLWEHLLPPDDIFSLFPLVTRFPLQMDYDLVFSGSTGSLTICEY